VSPRSKIVVVDGSNLATEGRSNPSLAQLDESVRAFLDERPTMTAIVVVDATFGHRIDKSEQARFKEAELAGEIVTPPAGAIGRGDAFILKIASRADGVVLSNDSFQEFHAEHPWLFEDGRLIGGKPIHGVGWIFTTRNPVRGPKSRAVRAKAATAPSSSEHTQRTTAEKPSARTTKGHADATAPRKRQSSAQPAKAAPRSTPTKQKVVAAKAATKAPAKAEAKRQAPARPAKQRAVAAAAQPAKATRQRATRPEKQPAAPARTSKPRTAKESGPVNTLRAFRALTSRHPLKSTVEGTVSSFTSHGAMITVTVGRATKVDSYVPLAGLGRPAPTKARDVLKLGEKRTFRITSIDEDRRIAELSLA
jgi:hypothetical protein